MDVKNSTLCSCLVLALLYSQTGFSQFNTSLPSRSGGFPASNNPANGSQGRFQPKSTTVGQSATGMLDQKASRFSSTPSQINWIDGSKFNLAIKLAQQSGKPLLVHFWNEKCGPCLMMEQKVFPHPQVIQTINTNFVAVKVNTLETPEIHRQLGVNRWPTDVFLSPDGKKLIEHSGLVPHTSYVQRLQSVSNMHAQMSKFKQNNAPSSFTTQSSPSKPANGLPNSLAANQLNQSNTLNQTNNPVASKSQFSTDGSQGQPRTVVNQYINQSNTSPKQASDQFVNQTANRTTPKVIVGFDGYCPVSITRDRQWHRGNQSFGCVHRGRLYYFTSDANKKLFLADPDKFAPVLAGYDVVEYIDNGKLIEGNNSIVLMPKSIGRVLRFSNAENQKKLMANPARYYQGVEVARQNIDSRFLR